MFFNKSRINKHLEEGDALYKNKKFDEAIEEYTKAIQLDKKNARAYAGRGRIYGYKRNYDPAIADLETALRIAPKAEDRLDSRAISLMGDMDRKELIDNYKARGQGYTDKRDYDKALADFNSALKVDPQNASIYQERGRAYMKMDDLDKSLADYASAIRIEPQDTNSYLCRGNIYKRQGNYDLAFKDYGTALKINPKNPFAYLNRGDAYHDKGDYQLALKDYEMAIQLNPSLESIHKYWIDDVKNKLSSEG